VTDYLRERFGQDKVYLMGHSGGSFIGIQAAARAPERYHAYVGVAQMAHQIESERLAYEYMLARFRATRNRSMVRALQAVPVTREGGTPDGYLKIRDPAMHRLGVGTTHDMTSIISGIFLPSWLSREYTLPEKIKMWRAKVEAGPSALWETMLATNLAEQLADLAVPVYFFHGIYDYTCSYPLAKRYFEQITAPVKGFHTFERSAHSPLFEEPERALEILRWDVLARTNRLSDAPYDVRDSTEARTAFELR
jgi:pimeloyl-ACP methyl ester carboxylesterase